MAITPKQFNLLATKDDLKTAIRESEERLGEKLDKVLTVVDKIAKDHSDHKIEHVSNLAAHDRFEKRITRVEKKAGIII